MHIFFKDTFLCPFFRPDEQWPREWAFPKEAEQGAVRPGAHRQYPVPQYQHQTPLQESRLCAHAPGYQDNTGKR